MKTISRLIVLMMMLTAVTTVSAKKEYPFNMPAVASVSIPKYEINIKDFGGVPDGKTLNTQAFDKAMADLEAKGGGRLVVPAGIWLTGPIQFEDNVELHVKTGALLLFTEDFDAYPEIETVFEGNKTTRKMSPLYADHKHDVAITGYGTIDAQGEAWRPAKKSKFTENQWKELTSGNGVVSNGIWYPNAKNDALAGTASKPDMRRALQRPVLLDFRNCKRVLLRDITLSNSPAWNCHPFKCEDVTIDGVTIRNPWYAQNGDGIDIESCNRVIVTNSTFDVGDDAICIKSGKDKEGREWKMPCQNVIIEGCTVLHGHGGFTIGSEMSSGVRNIYVHNCIFNGTDTGLRFKSTRGRGGVVENIYADDIRMHNIATDAITFSLYYFNKPVAGKGDKEADGKETVPPVTEGTPCFKNIYFSDIVCTSAKRAFYCNGLPEMPVENLQLTHSRFESLMAAEMHYCKNVLFDNVQMDFAKGDRLTMTDVTGFTEK